MTSVTNMLNPQRARRWGNATSHAIRLLAVRPTPIVQIDLATALGVTQARVSQIGKLLAAGGIRFSEVNQPDQRAMLVDLYIKHHLPSVETETLWYDIDSPLLQAERASGYLVGCGSKVVVSADAATDFIAPWRSPTLTVIYTDSDASLDDSGFVPAFARGEASIIVRKVKDASLLEPWNESPAPLPIAHPLQQIWDLHHLGGEDRKEAAERLMRRVVMGAA